MSYSTVHKGRRPSSEVRIGNVIIGGGNPIAVQSMTTVDTMDTEGCAEQIKRIRDAGCNIVRLTTRTDAEAVNISCIRAALKDGGIEDVALVADVHFSPAIALTAAEHADKVRINPGNYNDPDGAFFRKLLDKCRERGVAIRIGVNHGSLSPRVVETWGDTPRGMVESAMEMLRVCRSQDFGQVVVSMKSSNVRVMVEAYRMLARVMDKEGMHYPLHLGVTEAGNGMEGRVKSAVGIGTLLIQGIGDTVRVSLTEPPENEIPVANLLIRYARDRGMKYSLEPLRDMFSVPHDGRIETVGNIGGGIVPPLFSELSDEARYGLDEGKILKLDVNLQELPAIREEIAHLRSQGNNRPVFLTGFYEEAYGQEMWIKAAVDMGSFFIDGLAHGMEIKTAAVGDRQHLDDLSLAILQAARARISKTEYIACPGCGRTLFDLQAVLERVKENTAQLTGLKIAVMGCIVNGPGEMADADYGYVGAGPGKVSLYKGRKEMLKSIPETDALEKLIALIKENGDWK